MVQLGAEIRCIICWKKEAQRLDTVSGKNLERLWSWSPRHLIMRMNTGAKSCQAPVIWLTAKRAGDPATDQDSLREPKQGS